MPIDFGYYCACRQPVRFIIDADVSLTLNYPDSKVYGANMVTDRTQVVPILAP